jgi:hypothetical protein
MSYSDFIWENSLYVTGTQKMTGRVHGIPDELLCSLWEHKDAGPSTAGDVQKAAP